MTENYKSIYEPAQEPAEAEASQEAVQEAPHQTYTSTEQVAAILCLIFGFLFIRLALFHFNGLFTTLFYVALFTLEIVFLRKSGAKLDKAGICLAAVLYLFSAVPTITANTTIKWLNGLFLIFTSCLFLFRAGNPGKDIFRFLPLTLPTAVMGCAFTNFGCVFGAAASKHENRNAPRNFLYILGGLLLAIPLTGIVAMLLFSADMQFFSMFQNLFGNAVFSADDVVTLIPHLLLAIPVGAAIFGCLFRSTHPLNAPAYDTERCEKSLLALRFLPNPMVYVAVTPICILYLLFLFSQLSYFLGGFTGTLASGYTYAEYAREGFFQLCAVCCINLAVICIMEFAAKVTGIVKPLALKIYSVYLSICSIFLTGTAIAKMVLYIRYYGLTQLRIYTNWFMILLAVGFILIIIRQFALSIPICKIGFTAFVILFGLLCFSRPDDWMIRCNAEMYLSGQLETFDYELLEGLSDDAAAAISSYPLDAFHDADPDINATACIREILRDKEEAIDKDFWKELNLSAWMLRQNMR